MSRAITLAEIYSGESNPRGELARALLAHNHALRQIYAKCCEKTPDAYIVGYVMEVADAALREGGGE